MLVLPNLFKEKFPSLKVVHSSIGLIEEKREKGKEYFHDLVLENTAKSTGIVELLVGTSVAVENANQTLKETATYITDSAENDGVAKILEKLCLKEDE